MAYDRDRDRWEFDRGRNRDDEGERLRRAYGGPDRNRYGGERRDFGGRSEFGGLENVGRDEQRHRFEQDEQRDRYGRGGGEYGRGGYAREDYGRSDRLSGGYEAERGGDYRRAEYGRPDQGRGRDDPFRGGGYGAGRNESYGRGYGRDERHDDDRERDRGWFNRATDEVSSWFGDDDAERRRREDARRDEHRGRGPRGYTRSDERIREDVNDRLTDHPGIDASDIDVAVSGGEVTLSGEVDHRHAKRLAEDLVERVSGVTHVQNNLRVRQQGSASRSGFGNDQQRGARDLGQSVGSSAGVLGGTSAGSGGGQAGSGETIAKPSGKGSGIA